MEKGAASVLRLRAFESLEELPEKGTEFEVARFNISNFNLLMGDNAQGKSRLFRMLSFYRSLYLDVPRAIATHLRSTFTFDVENNNSSIGEVIYEIDVQAKNGKNIFSEVVKSNNVTIFSNKDNVLINEKEGTRIENFFIPDNVTALRSVTGNEYVTIKLLRDFFQRIVLVSSNKSRMIMINPSSIVPHEEGTDISYVLLNWKQKYPVLYNEIVADFRACYPFIRDIDFKSIPLPPTGQLFDSLALKEDDIEFDIDQMQWSDGIYRLLWLLLLPKIPFQIDEYNLPPSLILIDEIENGLDFKALKYIIQYLQEYSDDCQIMMSSHSPLVCEFVHPTNWIIVKRKGTKLSFIAPVEIEENLNEQLDVFKQKHWDFYLRHISNSKLYRVK